ncbi:serine/threonine-protein kinase CDG1 isoform X1 [Lactuca sativa]|uniref:serine/threonine-protein kinase CDG1 isoform X1 n=1 Tax=Lactuca sativa TaxID=4236 RepID=UPI001C692915|nr:serine/threonine-protein kinase CDG1 isoform X1 [Lactuca sativa]
MCSETSESDRLLLTSVQPCRHFSLAEIKSASKDFDDKLIIGQGGFGKVYKGFMYIEETSHVVAIKRLDSKSEQGALEFKAEIEMLSKLRHCHLVSLIGFCDDNNEMILVYAYMPNGTLYHHLHKSETPLNWVQRLKIAIGAGRGLDYLHTGFGTQQGVIHRDVKSSNILLDENWAAMISDFGLSKLGPINQSLSFIDASVKGTFGYLDPEYFYTRRLTRKTDVYAFGVVLFELLTGRLAVDEQNVYDQCSLVRWAQKCVKARKLDQMVDSSIAGTVFPKCLRGFAHIADRCLRSHLKERPTMAEIVVSLQALLELQERYDNSSEPSGISGFTWKIHKYLVSATKLNADQTGASSSICPENNMNRLPKELVAIDLKSFKYSELTSRLPKELVAIDLKSFKYSELTSATKNFGNDNLLSYKSFGKVYKGWIDRTTYSPSEDNTRLPVAIKRLDNYKCADQLDLEMMKEFIHPNLEKLIGYCLHGQKLFLVYEFMPNGNFEDLLDSGGVAQLPLVTKVKIAIGIARGIVFLHKTQDPVGSFISGSVSRSLLDRRKILLDEDFTAKLSGYDVIKLIRGFYPDETGRLRYGGISDSYPRWCGPLELQSDISGFTVVFAELVTGIQISIGNFFQEIYNPWFKQYKLSVW